MGSNPPGRTIAVLGRTAWRRVPFAYLQKLWRHWARSYGFRKAWSRGGPGCPALGRMGLARHEREGTHMESKDAALRGLTDE